MKTAEYFQKVGFFNYFLKHKWITMEIFFIPNKVLTTFISHVPCMKIDTEYNDFKRVIFLFVTQLSTIVCFFLLKSY